MFATAPSLMTLTSGLVYPNAAGATIRHASAVTSPPSHMDLCDKALLLSSFELTWCEPPGPKTPDGVEATRLRYPGRSKGSRKITGRPRTDVGICGPVTSCAASLWGLSATTVCPLPDEGANADEAAPAENGLSGVPGGSGSGGATVAELCTGVTDR